MKLTSLFAVVLVLGAVALTMRSQTAPPKPAALSAKIAVIAMRDAMLATQDGKAAAAQMQIYDGKRADLEKEATAIQALEEQQRKGAATMSADGQQKLANEIAARKKNLQRAGEDLSTEAESKDNLLMQDISAKMGAVIDQYAKKNGYTVVIDASAPLLWAAESANVTPEVIKAYDLAHPAAKK